MASLVRIAALCVATFLKKINVTSSMVHVSTDVLKTITEVTVRKVKLTVSLLHSKTKLNMQMFSDTWITCSYRYLPKLIC